MSEIICEQLWTSVLDAEELSKWLETHREGVPFAVLDRLDEIRFPARDEAIVLKDWPRGRIFGDSFEMRWELQGEAFRVWYTGTAVPGPGFKNHVLPQISQIEPCFLWGGSEARLVYAPHYRAVPGEGRRVQIICRRFIETDGRLSHYRFLGMERKNESI